MTYSKVDSYLICCIKMIIEYFLWTDSIWSLGSLKYYYIFLYTLHYLSGEAGIRLWAWKVSSLELALFQLWLMDSAFYPNLLVEIMLKAIPTESNLFPRALTYDDLLLSPQPLVRFLMVYSHHLALSKKKLCHDSHISQILWVNFNPYDPDMTITS